MSLREHLLMLARYNDWATRRLLDEHVGKLAEKDYRRDCGLFFKSVHGTLNHLLVGEHRLWWPRFAQGVSPQLALDAEVESERDALAQELIDGAGRWIGWLEALPESRLGSRIAYTTMRGAQASLPFGSTLAHVFNHGTHHRGQISAALTAMGLPCPVLDLVYMLQLEAAR
jgi:uncharacterized damage-inducible protein DinB